MAQILGIVLLFFLFWGEPDIFDLLRAAIVFLTIIVMTAVLAVPHIAIPVLVIAGSVASLMRIFIYMVEERER